MRNNNKFNLNNIKKIHFIVWFFLIFFSVIVMNLFSYTVFNYDFYQELADNQQIWKVTLPVNRWTIYSWWKTVFWTSLNLYDLAIDPQIIWDKEKLSNFLTDIVYNELCENQKTSKCESNLAKFIKVLEVPDFTNDEEFIKKFVQERINSKIYKTKIESVLISTELTEDKINKIANLGISWTYLNNSNLYINPEEFNNSNLNFLNLSEILNIPEDDLKRMTRKRDLRYIPILNKLSISSSEYIKNYIKEEYEVLRKWILEDEASISWFFILEPKPNRYYPENTLASQIVWFVDNSWNWNYWLEWYFNDILKWNNWQIISRKDINGRIINSISLDKKDLIWEWVRIISTIDRNVQKKLEDYLEQWVYKFRANKWSAIVMNPKTWDIIAMANYPTYDLNNYWDIYELEKVKYSKYPDPKTDLLWMPIYVEDFESWEKFFYDNKEIFLRKATREELWDIALVKYKFKNDFWAQAYKNDVISSLYEPGSIMKSITVAVWLDTWEINPYSMYMDKWFVDIDEFKIKNVSDKCLGYHSFWHALNFSCNVWMIRIVQRVWKVLLHQYLTDFWFWAPTWINLQWETYSELKPWERWSVSNLLTQSYWLGISVTEIQMAAAYSILANGGTYVTPKVIDEIIFPDWKTIKYKTEEQRRVIKKTTSDTISKMLVESNTIWAAKNWYVEWYLTAWKTWTSQIAYRWGYEKWVASTIWSYAWYWPLEDPKFVVIVKLERPRVSEYGWATSSYIFKDIVSYLYDYYGIPKKENKE